MDVALTVDQKQIPNTKVLIGEKGMQTVRCDVGADCEINSKMTEK